MNKLPIEFRQQSVDLFNEFHKIFEQILDFAAMGLGFNYNIFIHDELLLFDDYAHSLKYSHYLRLHGEECN